jgi:hypothetical protein
MAVIMVMASSRKVVGKLVIPYTSRQCAGQFNNGAAQVSLDPFIDIIGRQFKQPKEGLGYDNSLVAHMWRSLIFPDTPL